MGKYYSNLFSNNNSGNGLKVNSKTNSTQPKISSEHLILINKLTNCAELKKILKLLKSGKSPGIDRISNEILKHSFSVLKDCFVKLFNLILKVGKVPVTMCKGLITPVHKKGDPSNPDNFRPICVLSCLCKFLTNLLNHRLASIS